VVRGDIRVIHALSHLTADSRLGLVLSVDGPNEFAEVLLVHTANEFACGLDIVVPRKTASARFDIVIETDLRGVVWTWQLGAAFGWLDETALGAVTTAGSDELPDDQRPADVRTGLRLAGPSDARWLFKEAEGEALRLLTEDCTAALLDRGLIWQVDPGLLRPELLHQARRPADVLEELLHWAMTRTLTVNEADLVALADSGALTIEAWDSLGDLGPDVWMSLQDVLLAAATGVAAPGPSARLVTASHLRVAEDVTFEEVHVLALREAFRT
jgi:hypothetical protein